MPEVDKLIAKYQGKIHSQLGKAAPQAGAEESKVVYSREYQLFRKQFMPANLNIYEQLCQTSCQILKLKLKPEKEKEYQEAISIAHLNITPVGAYAFAILSSVLVIFLLGSLAFFITDGLFFTFFFFLCGVLIIAPLQRIPMFIASQFRMRASNQMVQCIFYVVTYMRHTSNLELAVDFASERLMPPLSLDLKKVLWDVETGEFDTVKESLDNYLEGWRKWNFEFIESFHLIESSLYEGNEPRRLESLDKALDVMLTGTYEKMLRYTHSLQSPITMLNMLGVILPILGLVILPLVVSFLEAVKWYHIAVLYDVLLPIGIYYLGKTILANRPTGYGQTDIGKNPQFEKYKKIPFRIGKKELLVSPLFVSLSVGMLLVFIGILPLLIHAANPDIPDDIIASYGFRFLEYRDVRDINNIVVGKNGPFGIGATLLSLFFTLGLGLGLGMHFKFRSQNLIKIREETKRIENEFASALFQLGNRLGDGLPAEIAFDRVSTAMQGTVSGEFFQLVSMNITKLGMGVEEAIFDSRHGALVAYPSAIIESSMKVLVESVRKGPRIAAQALVNVSRYIKEIHTVNERLQDLLAEIISSMKSQISFLTPAISGIVIGITSMITAIIGNLDTLLPRIGGAEAAGQGASALAGLFKGGIPTYWFQIVVGIYVVELIYILTVLVNGIENGSDKLNERYLLGVNLIRSTTVYCLIAFIITVLFNLIAGVIMSNLIAGL